ncbi:MAG TPA: TraR/DksA C4-type zinc finger protein [Verrucomicrobiales bacterium]|nr:TraR/DksA C4-type zinc finger protein [Verrucomicrobiales bacterium]
MNALSSISDPDTGKLQPPERWSRHYHTLLSLRNRLLADGAARRGQATEPVERYSRHPGDSGTDAQDHDSMFTLLSMEQSALTEVSEAIDRIHTGTYGVCEETGLPIPEERLRVIPWARCTLAAEVQRERAASPSGPEPAGKSFRK